jgi:hypothetical protein
MEALEGNLKTAGFLEYQVREGIPRYCSIQPKYTRIGRFIYVIRIAQSRGLSNPL